MVSSKALSRTEVLALLKGRRNHRIPCFSGLISVTHQGLEKTGMRLSEIYADPLRMAAAAASSYRLFGFESASVPLDMCVEASVLGAQVDYREDAPRPELPRVAGSLVESAADLLLNLPSDFKPGGRIASVIEAIGILKQGIGHEVVVGAWVPGPMTLMMQLVNVSKLMREIATGSPGVDQALDPLTDIVVEVALAYQAAGADFITVHEMGGSPGFIGQPNFEKLILPRLQRMLAALRKPRILSICGNTNRSMALLAEAGADALSVDQTNNLAESRKVLGPEPILLGNIDPVEILTNGDEAATRKAVITAISAGVDAIWPGCDLSPMVSAENMQAMVAETRLHQRS